MNSIREEDLVLPALDAISASGGALDMTKIIVMLRNRMQPSGRDSEPLKNRNDDKFSQKVRNLGSHKTLENRGFVTIEGSGKLRRYQITEAGCLFLKNYQADLRTLDIFPYEDKILPLAAMHEPRSFSILSEYGFEEGRYHDSNTKKRSRSSKLRSIAVEHFTVNGCIKCQACTFDFDATYGKELSDGFIEIHHLKPICLYDDEDIQATLEKKLDNLAPVCSNCHSIIHRRVPCLPILELGISVPYNG